LSARNKLRASELTHPSGQESVDSASRKNEDSYGILNQASQPRFGRASGLISQAEYENKTEQKEQHLNTRNTK